MTIDIDTIHVLQLLFTVIIFVRTNPEISVTQSERPVK